MGGALLNGANLFIVQNTKEFFSDIIKFTHTVALARISILFLTRSLFDHLYLLNEKIFAGLRYLLVGGEALTPSTVAKNLMQKARSALGSVTLPHGTP
jgi:hypothetical protein